MTDYEEGILQPTPAGHTQLATPSWPPQGRTNFYWYFIFASVLLAISKVLFFFSKILVGSAGFNMDSYTGALATRDPSPSREMLKC
jgi:hypothetical protein